MNTTNEQAQEEKNITLITGHWQLRGREEVNDNLRYTR